VNRSQFAFSVLKRETCVGSISPAIPVPVTVNSIAKWSDPRSGSICQLSILLASVLVANVRSSTLGLVRFDR